jgi:hypothetical protein
VGAAARLIDRSSRPHHSPNRLSEQQIDAIVALRRQRLTAPAIARRLHRPVSTVSLVLRRAGLGRIGALDPKPTIIRYQRENPGELIHIDIKKLGRIDGIGHRITGDRAGQSNKRGTGWEYVHVAVDDASRLAYTELRAVPGAPTHSLRCEEVAGFGAAALLAPQPGEIASGAQFQRFRLLGSDDADRLLKGGLALVELVFGEQHGPGEPVQFRIPKMLAGGTRCVQSLP